MSKAHGNKNLFGQRALLAVSLAASITAFGCTTDRHLGNGDPVVTPGLRTTPTSSPTTGSESGTNAPMFSSSRFADTSIRNGAPAIGSPAGAAAVMADVQPRVRVLGQTTDGVTPPAYHSGDLATGQFQNPALATNPQLTVNSTISSNPVPAISSGAGGAAGGGVSGAVVVGGTTAAAVIGSPAGGTTLSPTAASTVAPVAGSFAGGVSPTAASVATPSVGAFASGPSPTAVTPVTPVAGTTASVPLSPTAASVVTPPAGVGNSPAAAVLASRRTATATSATAAATVAPVAAASRATRTTGTTSGNIRIVTDENGRAVVTNSTSRDQ